MDERGAQCKDRKRESNSQSSVSLLCMKRKPKTLYKDITDTEFEASQQGFKYQIILVSTGSSCSQYVQYPSPQLLYSTAGCFVYQYHSSSTPLPSSHCHCTARQAA